MTEGTDAPRRWLGRTPEPTHGPTGGDNASNAADPDTRALSGDTPPAEAVGAAGSGDAAAMADPASIGDAPAAAPPDRHPASGRGKGAGKRSGGKGRSGGKRGVTAGATPPGERRQPGGLRHQGRMLALMVLYETDLTDHPSEQVIARTVADPASLTGDADHETAAPESANSGAREASTADATAAAEAGLAEMRKRVARLVGGVQTRIGEIDPIIAAAAPAFPIEQIAGIDRSVLRLAIYELLYEPDVPVRAVINEAVELAKRFGGDNSGRFVNGVLGTVSGRIDAEARRTKAQPTA